MSLFSFCFRDLSIDESGVLKSPTINVWGATCALSFTKVSLMNVAALAFGASIFRIENSSWMIWPLMCMKWPSVSFLITLGWKSILLDIRMTTPACFFSPFAYKLFSSLSFWGSVYLFPWDGFPVSSKMLGSVCVASLLVYVFFIGELSPLILRDIKEK